MAVGQVWVGQGCEDMGVGQVWVGQGCEDMGVGLVWVGLKIWVEGWCG